MNKMRVKDLKVETLICNVEMRIKRELRLKNLKWTLSMGQNQYCMWAIKPLIWWQCIVLKWFNCNNTYWKTVDVELNWTLKNHPQQWFKLGEYVWHSGLNDLNHSCWLTHPLTRVGARRYYRIWIFLGKEALQTITRNE